jgi:subtilisin family serine protease
VQKVARLDPRLAASRTRTVPVELLAARPAEARTLVRRHGGRIERSYRGVVEAVVPKASLPALAGSSAVRLVREPARPVPESVRGQGVLSSGAPAWHRAGAHGEGVKIAVVDLGFDGYARSRANGDLPPGVVRVNFCGSGRFEATSHGTAVAEIVSEVAPAADLYLVCVRDVAGLGLAVGYARAKGIQIVNHSASWFNTGRGDGAGAAGSPEGIVAAARAAGILWVNAAGNRAEQHWSGSFVDANANGWSEYAPADEGNTLVVPAGSFACAALKWDDWPASTEDYDLYLTRSPGGAVVARSNGPQSGLEPPTELACAINTATVAETYAIGIKANRVTGKPVRFDLFVYPGPNLEHRVAQGSITEPGTSAAALTVGAACWLDNRLEAYSSQGPTIDARTKPDLVGPDSVSSFSFGPFSACGVSGFAGTSAAAPHVAGAAALVKQAVPAFGPDELQAYLQDRAVDLGPAGLDSTFGSGMLSLAGAPRIALGACKVPSVVGRRSAKAKAAIRRAGCRVGRIERSRSRTRAGRVVTQSPRAGSRLAAQGRVHLTISLGRRG